MVIYYITPRWWNFIVSKNDIDKKIIKRELKHRKVLYKEICTKKRIDTIFWYWNINDTKEWNPPYDKCWVTNLDDKYNDRLSREEIKLLV